MRLLRIIRAVHQKPKHVRDNIAFVVAAVVTALVAVVWVYHAPGTFNQSSGAMTEAESPPFFSQIRESISAQTASLKDAVTGGVNAPLTATTTDTATPAADTSFQLTEENRRSLSATSTSTQPSDWSGVVDDRRVVLIATTSASSTAAP